MITGAILHILFDYSTYIPGPTDFGKVFILPPSFATTAGPVIVRLWRGSDYSGGTPFFAYNPNITAVKTQSATTLTVGPTGNNKGTVALEYLIGGDSQGNQAASGAATGLSFFIRSNSGKALVEIENLSGSAITFHYGQVLYET